MDIAQSTNILPVKKIDNDSLIAAYTQSIHDVSYGQYLKASFGLLKRLSVEHIDQIDDPDVVDQWAQVMSTITNTPTYNKAKSPDFHVSKKEVAELKASTAVPALKEIVKRARKTQIVILNENHLDPRGRAFGLEVAKALRPLGYTVLALEALKPFAEDHEEERKMKQLSTDGVVRGAVDFYSGYYFDDPVFADFVRQSLAMGYHPVSYETAGRGYTALEREQAQAENLIRRSLNRFPKAKILVYVGERHAAERSLASEEQPYQKMAEILKEKTGIDPLTIDQAELSPIPMNRPDVDLYSIASSKATTTSMVLFHKNKAISVGLLSGAVDLQVIHPPYSLIQQRPNWLLTMHRSPSPIPQDLLPTSGIRLIQAFIANSPENARPIDQVLVEAGKNPPSLMLPNVKVRFATQDF